MDVDEYRISVIAAVLRLLLIGISVFGRVETAAAASSNCLPLPLRQVVNSIPFITAANSKFGLGIEGTSVDSTGRVYAAGYSGGTNSGLGTLSSADGLLRPMQNLFFLDQSGSSSFNGFRFLPLSPELSGMFASRSIATDVRGHRVVQLLQWKQDERVRASTFCGNSSMIQPNDIAVAMRSGRVYLSGGDYGKVTTEVGDGELWVCDMFSSFYNSSFSQLAPVSATRLGLFGPTNGIEVSPDEKTLYLSESTHRNSVPVENRIWKFAIDPATGLVSEKALLVEFEELDGSGYVDVDGMRTDMDGNLFVARNGMEGEVVKLSPEGELLLKIKVPGVKEVTNVEFGGPEGTTLFIVGKCIDDPNLGCTNILLNNPTPGRAWTALKSF